MAKLAPKDPQFGIPVASRIDKDTALLMNKQAEKQGKSLSRYISEYIKRATSFEKKIAELASLIAKEKEISTTKERKVAELQSQFTQERELMQKAVGRFILVISEERQKQAGQFIQLYNSILKDEKSKLRGA